MNDRELALNELNVSRETIERLDSFVHELIRWNKKINLVSPKTLSEVWSRHILDSGQIVPHIPTTATNLCDLGSGGGFPGLVVAILVCQARPDLRFTLIDSDTRKCVFLRRMADRFQLKVNVLNKRIEQAEPVAADIITARALTSVNDLIGFGVRHLATGGEMLLLKGKTADEEIESALENWRFDHQKYASTSDPEATLLRIRNPERRRTS